MSDGRRIVEVSVTEEVEQNLEVVRRLMSPRQVGDAGLFQIAAASIQRLVQRAMGANCPHAKHALEHIGFEDAIVQMVLPEEMLFPNEDGQASETLTLNRAKGLGADG